MISIIFCLIVWLFIFNFLNLNIWLNVSFLMILLSAVLLERPKRFINELDGYDLGYDNLGLRLVILSI